MSIRCNHVPAGNYKFLYRDGLSSDSITITSCRVGEPAVPRQLGGQKNVRGIVLTGGIYSITFEDGLATVELVSSTDWKTRSICDTVASYHQA